MSAPGAAVLRVIGEVDACSLLRFRGEADELLLDERVRELVVDLSETTALGVMGLGLLLHLKMLACENAIGLAVRTVPPGIRRVLTMGGLDRILDIRD